MAFFAPLTVQNTMPIKPHGAQALRPLFVADPSRREALLREAATLPSLTLNSAAAANAVMLAAGYFTPLAGYMNLADALSVACLPTFIELDQWQQGMSRS